MKRAKWSCFFEQQGLPPINLLRLQANVSILYYVECSDEHFLLAVQIFQSFVFAFHGKSTPILVPKGENNSSSSNREFPKLGVSAAKGLGFPNSISICSLVSIQYVISSSCF